MGNILKYLPLILKFKNVADAYKAETGKDKPAYLGRTFIGAVLVVIFSAVSIALGVQFDSTLIESVTGGIDTIITAGIALYGVVLTIVGIVKKKPAQVP